MVPKKIEMFNRIKVFKAILGNGNQKNVIVNLGKTLYQAFLGFSSWEVVPNKVIIKTFDYRKNNTLDKCL